METKIALLLRVAKEQLAYTIYIGKYPAEHGYKHLDVTAPRDKFYKNVNVAFFHESLLAVFSLLDGDSRVISFLNWTDFMGAKGEEITAIKNKFTQYGFATLRNQVVAHLDTNNSLNRIPTARQTAMISEEATTKLEEIINELIILFLDYTGQHGNQYAESYFDVSKVVAQLAEIMEVARPTMTQNPVI